MKLYISIRQLFRSPVRMLLHALILAAITAFFCLSLNLWRNSEANLRLADETYKTIAVMELYADVDGRGNLLSESDEGYAGYLPTAVSGYDLTPIVNAPGVIRYDLRARYGAYIPGEVAVQPAFVTLVQTTAPVFCCDIVRFTVEPAQTEENREVVEIPAFGISSDVSAHAVKVNVLESATDIFQYNEKIYITIWLSESDLPKHGDEVRRLNGGGDAPVDVFILRPGVEYVAFVRPNSTDGFPTLMDGRFLALGLSATPDEYSMERWVEYSTQRGESINIREGETQPFWVQFYEDVLHDSALNAYYEQAKRAYYISARSFGVMATDDVMGVPAFHLGNAYIPDGRIFTQEEYESGARVCMVSGDLARAQGWSVGDMIGMNFYQYDYFLNDVFWGAELAPFYTSSEPDDFFDAEQYRIVGIYALRPITEVSTVSESALSVPWNTIFVPKKSIHNASSEDTLPVSGALLTLWLKNGSIDEFLNEMDSLGLTMQKSGDYETKFTFYDQGYSKIQPSLVALSGTAELLLIASAALLLCAGVLLAFFYALAQRQSLGVMRMLGCGKGSAFFASLLGALFVSLSGVCAGAIVGHLLTEKVGAKILAGAANEPAAYAAFSAFLATDQEITIEFALGADARTTMLALILALVLFLLSLCGFLLMYLRKGPRELLPQSHA